jgi:hypothetical protein
VNFVIPPKSQVGVFNPADIGEDASIAVRIDGDKEEWNPPALQSAFPDWSKVPQLRKYFGRKGGSVYPAWLFHPTKPDKLVNSAQEAEEMGVFYREATIEERGQFGIQSLWDWERGDDDQKWRPFPQQRKKFDPHHMETGKIYQAPAGSPSTNVDSLVAAVTASVLAAMKTTAAPSHVDSKEWAEFQAFQAFKKTSETVNALADEDDRASLLAEAEHKGIKVDKRWSTERLKAEVTAKAA